mmetsp:Transcript_10108/g.14598  ORF Transcript_10108/g.14598 Transcript_10108/m.14598 type:complete len:184 (-) Transcript_10108:745-1296(-)
MWNGKFEERATGHLKPGDKVWICGGSFVNSQAVFVAHKEKTVEVRRSPGWVTNHVRPEHVIPLSAVKGFNNGCSNKKTYPKTPSVKNRQASMTSTTRNAAESDESTTITAPTLTPTIVSSVAFGSLSGSGFSLVSSPSPVKLRLQELIEIEKEKARESERKLLSLMNALELVENAERETSDSV